MSMEDNDLIQFLNNGNDKEKAYRYLIQRYKRPLYTMIRKIVIDHHDTDDILQLTFIKVFKYIHTFKGDSKLYSWLYAIARQEAYGFMKKKAGELKVSLDQLTTDRMMEITAETEFYQGTEEQLRLQKAVAALPEKQREVFNLKYYDNLKYTEIASITGTSIGGLKANYHLALKNLKVRLTSH